MVAAQQTKGIADALGLAHPSTISGQADFIEFSA
jgi:hypothetical protein